MDTLRNVLTRSQQKGVAVGHFNVADLVLLKAVLAAAVEVRVPVLVGASEGERSFFGTYELAALVKVMREENDVPVFLNADHTHSERLAEQGEYEFRALIRGENRKSASRGAKDNRASSEASLLW
jgi:fructose-bisphosphate aldolase class II